MSQFKLSQFTKSHTLSLTNVCSEPKSKIILRLILWQRKLRSWSIN